MENKKQLYDLINGNPDPGTDCESTANEPRGAYLLQLKNWFEIAYSEWNDKKTAYETAKDNYESLTCSDTEYIAKKSTCDPMLESIENNACNYAQGHAIQCNGYDACYDEEVAEYESAKKVTQDQEAGAARRRADNIWSFQLKKKLFTPLDLCVSSCWGAHATPFVCVLPNT